MHPDAVALSLAGGTDVILPPYAAVVARRRPCRRLIPDAFKRRPGRL